MLLGAVQGAGFAGGAWMILLVILVLVDIYVGYLFGQIAEMKGHKSTKYMLICIFLGIVGYIMVCALPDRAKDK